LVAGLMNRNIVIVTGASGFLGSAITIDLSRHYRVFAVDQREPGAALRKAAGEVVWQRLDISQTDELTGVFQHIRRKWGHIDFVVHLAAFYHFGKDPRSEYARTNVQGTANVIRAAKSTGAKRIIFASSVAAMEPPPPGQTLTEKTPASDYLPYAKSKAEGEKLLAEASDDLPAIVIRIGAAFSDWCELPALYSLIRLWGRPGVLGRMIPGAGKSGMPYIHRDDLVRLVRRCLELHEGLSPFEIFLACQQGAVLHNDLFPLIQQIVGKVLIPRPIHVPPAFASIGLYSKLALGYLTRNLPYEKPWMLKFIDRPWVADTTYTQRKLGWNCSPGRGVLERFPFILQQCVQQHALWEERNRQRNERRYIYSP
jgi:nucleoside-diphosphate-sugar epimerase